MDSGNRLVSFPLLSALLTVVVLGACGGDADGPAGPGDAELPIRWTFESGLEGWDLSEQCNGNPACYPVGFVTAENGMIVLEGAGDPGEPNASISRALTLPAGSATLEVRAISSCTGTSAADTDLRIRIQAGASSTVVQNWIEVRESWETVSIPITGFAGQQIAIYIEQNDNGEQEDAEGMPEALCIDEVVVTDAT